VFILDFPNFTTDCEAELLKLLQVYIEAQGGDLDPSAAPIRPGADLDFPTQDSERAAANRVATSLA